MKTWRLLIVVLALSCKPEKKYPLYFCGGDVTIELPHKVELYQVPRKLFGSEVMCDSYFHNEDSSIAVDVRIQEHKYDVSNEFLFYEIDRLKVLEPTAKIISKSIGKQKGMNVSTIVFNIPNRTGDGGYRGLRKVFETAKGVVELEIMCREKTNDDEIRNTKFINNVDSGITINKKL